MRAWLEELSDRESKNIIQTANDGPCAKRIRNMFSKKNSSQTVDVTKFWVEEFRFSLI